MSNLQQGSEVAQLLQKIREEYESARIGLSGFACGTSQHEVITRKMENMGKYHEELRALVGDESMALVAQALGDSPDEPHPSAQ